MNDTIVKAFIYRFSAIICWAQAGDLHRLLQSGERLFQQATLSQAQRK